MTMTQYFPLLTPTLAWQSSSSQHNNSYLLWYNQFFQTISLVFTLLPWLWLTPANRIRTRAESALVAELAPNLVRFIVACGTKRAQVTIAAASFWIIFGTFYDMKKSHKMRTTLRTRQMSNSQCSYRLLNVPSIIIFSANSSSSLTILDSGFWILDSGFWILDSWILPIPQFL